MGICDWDQEDINRLDEGLRLIGWHCDSRLTSDDGLVLADIANEATQMNNGGLLSPVEIDRLSLKAFEVLHFQIMNVQDRAMEVSSAYSESTHLGKLVPIIDQSLLCYYRGYYTASLSILFISLESYLRSLSGWNPGDRDPSFNLLRDAIHNLPESESRDDAQRIIDIVYSRYDASNPPQFYFNRHGLLHGLREGMSMDRLNCVRMYLLFDSLVAAEGLGNGGLCTDLFKSRTNTYLECEKYLRESKLLYPELSRT